MARSHGRVMSRIWSDPQFLALTAPAQRAYMLLLSQPNLTHAGTIPLTVRRWASVASDTVEADMVSALRELERAGFIVVDGTTEELLVRTLIRNDGVWKQPKVFLSAKADALAISSRKLRRALVVELRLIPVERDDATYRKGDVAFERDALLATLADPEPEPPETLTDTPTKPSPIPDREPPRSARGGAPTPAPTPFPSHSPPVPALRTTAPTIQQRADPLVRAYHQRLDGMCNWPAVLGIVKKAIRTERWTDQAIEDGLLRLADEGRPLTTESLRIELDGLTPRGQPLGTGNRATERHAQGIAVIRNLQQSQSRGEIA